jgi:hypothetical protein
MRMARIASLSEVLEEEVESLRRRPAGFGDATVAVEEGEEQQRLRNAEEVVKEWICIYYLNVHETKNQEWICICTMID